MSGPKHTPTVLSGPCPSCDGAGGWDDAEAMEWAECPDCAGTGKAENSITANERLRDAAPRLAEALKDAMSGLRYIRERYGELDGVGWQRIEAKANAALEGNES